LALDVYFAECRRAKALELGCSVSDFYTVLIVAFVFNNVLHAVGFDKITAYFVIVEAKLISQESKGDICISDTR
jgi:hypothetical protein